MVGGKFLFGVPFRLIDCPDMKRINLGSLYKAGSAIGELESIPAGTRLAAVEHVLNEATKALQALCSDASMDTPGSKRAATQLLQFIMKIDQPLRNTAPWDDPPDVRLDQDEFSEKASLIYVFNTVLSSELTDIHTYYVSQVLGYSTDTLVSNAISLFPEEVRSRLPQRAISDIREAGRCLAFDVPPPQRFTCSVQLRRFS